jgi:hypothetical protein
MTGSTSRRRFVGFAETDDTPNIVVDGSPTPATVLTLTHWPGIAQPVGLEADLSAEMAYRYLDRPPQHAPAEVVTNNHFDQDGLVSVHALVEPEIALRHRELLVDVAAAGDFGTYRDRAAARASMTIWAYADAALSPIADELRGLPYPDQCRTLYEATLPLLVQMATEPDRFRRLWAEEDDNLTAGEKAIAAGDVIIDEHPRSDLAVVTIGERQPRRPGHRFGSDRFEEIHPMAIHNATDCLRLLVVHGHHYRFVDRYESWVQYRSRRPVPRVDLQRLADHLTELETGAATWSATPPSALTPSMAPDGDSSLVPDIVIAELTRHLRTSPPAWDPYRPRVS